MEADIGLARDVQRLVEQRPRFVALAAIQRDLRQPLQRKGFAGAAADGAVQPRAERQVLLGGLQVARQQFRLPAQRHAEGMAARGAQALAPPPRALRRMR